VVRTGKYLLGSIMVTLSVATMLCFVLVKEGGIFTKGI
jgi:hypothetical protein